MPMQPASAKASAWTGDGPAFPALSSTIDASPDRPRRPDRVPRPVDGDRRLHAAIVCVESDFRLKAEATQRRRFVGVSATAPLFPDMAAAAEQRWNTRVFEIFGATEVGSIASRRTSRATSGPPIPASVITPRRADGEPVEALVSGPFAEPCRLSDMVEMLDAHHFRLLGRRADMIKLGGRRASLAELNRILTGIEGVLDGQFVAPEDLDRRPTARLLVFVVAPERSADDILAACAVASIRRSCRAA